MGYEAGAERQLSEGDVVVTEWDRAACAAAVTRPRLRGEPENLAEGVDSSGKHGVGSGEGDRATVSGHDGAGHIDGAAERRAGGSNGVELSPFAPTSVAPAWRDPLRNGEATANPVDS